MKHIPKKRNPKFETPAIEAVLNELASLPPPKRVLIRVKAKPKKSKKAKTKKRKAAGIRRYLSSWGWSAALLDNA